MSEHIQINGFSTNEHKNINHTLAHDKPCYRNIKHTLKAWQACKVAAVPSSVGEPWRTRSGLSQGTTHPLTNPAMAPKAKSDSDDGCTCAIEQSITIMASKVPSDGTK